LVGKDCAIFFDEEAFSIKSEKLMGRNSAGDSFLKGYFTHGTPEHFWVYAKTKNQAQIFADRLSQQSKKNEAKFISWNSFSGLKDPGTIFFPGPNFKTLAWQRRLADETGWSICGITHTTSSAMAMDAIGSFYTEPIKSWDALICTSNSVKNNVEFILENKKRYLKDELGLLSFTEPKLPVIPLGINTKDFKSSEENRQLARKSFEIDENTLVVLYVGRLSFHAKANPVPMYLAVEKAAKLNPSKKIKIIECGWYSNDWIKSAFSELSTNILDDVELITIDGRDQEKVKTAWHSADIFCSFSDNIQETFGISPIEAMASGLPVVVSDWDGYKESVRDEVDGFRIPTIMPEGGFGSDLAMSYAMELDDYDRYIGKTSAFVAIDIEHAVVRFDQLFKSEELRKTLGQNGKAHATKKYDWKAIIPAYEELWCELYELRSKHKSEKLGAKTWPERPDPYMSFSHYSTRQLGDLEVFELAYENYYQTVIIFNQFKNFHSNNFLAPILLNENNFLRIFKFLENDRLTSRAILKKFDEALRPMVYRNLFWLLKMGLLKTDNN